MIPDFVFDFVWHLFALIPWLIVSMIKMGSSRKFYPRLFFLVASILFMFEISLSMIEFLT